MKQIYLMLGYIWFSFGIFISACGQDLIPIKSATLLLYEAANPKITTPNIDIWTKVNKQSDDLPFGWKFISSKSPLYLPDISTKELSRYQMLYLSIPKDWPSLAPDEQEKLRGFLEKGGVLWVDFVEGSNASHDTYMTLPWPFDVESDQAFLIPASKVQMMPYPFKFSPFELSELESFSPKVIHTGNGWMILTEHVSKDGPLKHTFVKWIVNVLTLGFDFPSKGSGPNQTLSRPLDLPSSFFLEKTIEKKYLHPLSDQNVECTHLLFQSKPKPPLHFCLLPSHREYMQQDL